MGDFPGVKRYGLFAQHVLAGFDRRNGSLHMEIIWQRNVDRFDIWIRQQRLITGMNPRDLEPFGDAAGLRGITGRHRNNLRSFGF